MVAKQRLDNLLVERGLAPSRTKAQALIMAGEVVVGSSSNIKPYKINVLWHDGTSFCFVDRMHDDMSFLH